MQKQLTVSVVEPSGLLYGSELALLDILENLNLLAYRPEVILPKNCLFRHRLDAVGVPVRAVLISSAHRDGRLRRAVSYLRLASYWWRNPPDIVYLNQGGILRPMAAIAGALKLPVVCQIQTLEDAQWVSSTQWAQKWVTSFICNSRFIRCQTNVAPERMSMLYYGYKPKGLANSRRQHIGPTLQVGLLGRICESKGHYLVVEAARKLKAAGGGI